MVDDRGDDLDLHDQLAVALSERAAAARGVPLSETLAREYATQGHLTIEEAAAITQGHAPLLRGTLRSPTCIDEFQGAVGRLLHDAKHGRLPMPCKPVELEQWAKLQGLELPPDFINGLHRPKRSPSPPPVKPDPKQQDRIDCQGKAQKIWVEKAGTTIASMLSEREIAPYTRKYTPDTVRKWLSQVDPRPPEQKPGARRKPR